MEAKVSFILDGTWLPVHDCSRDLKKLGASENDRWVGLLAEEAAYIELALEPVVQHIVLLDGPAYLGDPSQWPSQNSGLVAIQRTVETLIARSVLKPLDPNAMARLLNSAALNAALWVAASDARAAVLPKATAAFRALATGLLQSDESHGR